MSSSRSCPRNRTPGCSPPTPSCPPGRPAIRDIFMNQQTQIGTAPEAEPQAESQAEPNVRRWTEQRWLVDNIIRANGIDWDQPRSFYMNAACGIEASADFAAIRQRIQKYADIVPAFVATAKRREAKARAAEAEGLTVTARDNYFMAAVHWGAAQWPLHANDAENLACNASKRACYGDYARLADHRIEPVFLRFGDGTVPGWFHLPPGYQGGRIPVVISFPGMDTFKELFVALNGDRWLSRGVAVLALDGPGQAECRLLGLTVSMENWTTIGKVVVDWLLARPEVDPARIGIFGNSFGSFFATLSPPPSRASWPASPTRPASSRVSIRSLRRPRRPSRS